MIETLSNHLWQSTMFAIAIACLTLVFRRHRAQVRYGLWLCASLKFLLPLAVFISLGSHLAPRSGRPLVMPSASIKVLEISEPFSSPLVQAGPPAGPHEDRRPYLLLGVWAAGALAVVLMRLRGLRALRSALAASRPLPIAFPFSVRSSPGLLEPGIVGLWRPILLLPDGIAGRLTPDQLQAVLAHELCHARRRDNLSSAAHMLVEMLFWFHPLVWWIGARLIAERERACDEAVLRLGNEPSVYANGILGVCSAYLQSPLRCVSGVTGSDLKQRICGILSGHVGIDLTLAGRALLLLAGIFAVAAPVLVGTLRAPAVLTQSAAAAPAFEAVSIHTCKAGEVIDPGDGRGIQRKSGKIAATSSPGRLSTGCDTVADLIRSAYVQYAGGYLRRDPAAPPVTGGPSWISSERYQINARAPGSPDEGTMRGVMMQRLLEDRFRLQLHHESKDVPVYELAVAKGGPKLTAHPEGSCILNDDFWRPVQRDRDSALKTCHAQVWAGHGPAHRVLSLQGATVGQFCQLLDLVMDRPVADKSGIAGLFDFEVEFAQNENTPTFAHEGDSPDSGPPAEPQGPTIFAALAKLGLKLEPARGSQEHLVIDRIARPTPN